MGWLLLFDRQKQDCWSQHLGSRGTACDHSDISDTCGEHAENFLKVKPCWAQSHVHSAEGQEPSPQQQHAQIPGFKSFLVILPKSFIVSKFHSLRLWWECLIITVNISHISLGTPIIQSFIADFSAWRIASIIHNAQHEMTKKRSKVKSLFQTHKRPHWNKLNLIMWYDTWVSLLCAGIGCKFWGDNRL